MTTTTKPWREQLSRPTRYGYRRSVVANWCGLTPGDTVLLLGPAAEQSHKGTVDAIVGDGTMMWVVLENAGGRRLFHHADGYQTLVDPVVAVPTDQ
ncbi:hypothetical protein AB6813_22130 [bacterium RCC_150]